METQTINLIVPRVSYHYLWAESFKGLSQTLLIGIEKNDSKIWCK